MTLLILGAAFVLFLVSAVGIVWVLRKSGQDAIAGGHTIGYPKGKGWRW